MNEVNTKIEEAQKAGQVVGTEAGNRMHQEVYGATTGASPSPIEKDANGNQRQSEHLPSLQLSNNQIEGAMIGASVGMTGAMVFGAGVFAPVAGAAGAAVGAWIESK